MSVEIEHVSAEGDERSIYAASALLQAAHQSTASLRVHRARCTENVVHACVSWKSDKQLANLCCAAAISIAFSLECAVVGCFLT